MLFIAPVVVGVVVAMHLTCISAFFQHWNPVVLAAAAAAAVVVWHFQCQNPAAKVFVIDLCCSKKQQLALVLCCVVLCC